VRSRSGSRSSAAGADLRLTGEGVDEILPLAARISEQYRRRVDTGDGSTRAWPRAMDKHHPPTRGGKALGIYYATQAQAAPPIFVLFSSTTQAHALLL